MHASFLAGSGFFLMRSGGRGRAAVAREACVMEAMEGGGGLGVRRLRWRLGRAAVDGEVLAVEVWEGGRSRGGARGRGGEGSGVEARRGARWRRPNDEGSGGEGGSHVKEASGNRQGRENGGNERGEKKKINKEHIKEKMVKRMVLRTFRYFASLLLGIEEKSFYLKFF